MLSFCTVVCKKSPESILSWIYCSACKSSSLLQGLQELIIYLCVIIIGYCSDVPINDLLEQRPANLAAPSPFWSLSHLWVYSNHHSGSSDTTFSSTSVSSCLPAPATDGWSIILAGNELFITGIPCAVQTHSVNNSNQAYKSPGLAKNSSSLKLPKAEKST